MIVALDLDDTLYPEETFVRSGFHAVARALHERWGVDEAEAFDVMWRSLSNNGRGTQFDEVVRHFGLRQSVPELVRVYRHHTPSITLPEESRRALEALAPRPLYVVTDGHQVVQQAKIDALGIAPLLRHAYLTHRYGIHNRKPSARVFELMMRRERCGPGDIVYVGDDPSKDFRGIRPLGIHTIRVLTGRHSVVEVPAGDDAERTVAGIGEVPGAVEELEGGMSAVAVIVQARMTSSRLPGKVLMDLGPGTTLEVLCRRLRRVTEADSVLIATSTEDSDDPIADAGLDVPVVRGPLDDVLERYRLAAERAGCDGVVRITSDCPLVAPELIDRLVALWRGDDALDYVWNTRKPLTFPDGLDVEVVSRRALEEAAAETAEPYDREHVTPFVRDRPERFPQRDLRVVPAVREVKLSLDTPDDLETIRAFIAEVGPDPELEEILAAAGGGATRMEEG